MDRFDIRYSDTIDVDTNMVVEGTILSPLEEDMAYSAYKNKIPIYKAQQFEKLYAEKLNDDSLLMSLKLSNDQERLSRLLHNTHIENSLFLKLVNIYDWGEDGLFESSENMEISTLFAKRFYNKERFDPATFYSPISIFEIGIMSEDEMVLQTLFSMPELEVKQSRKRDRRPNTIKEALATNRFLNSHTLQRLLRLNDSGVDYFLAQNSIIDDEIAKILLQRADIEIKRALSTNENLSDDIFYTLLLDKELLESLLYYQKIDINRFKKLDKVHPNIGANKNLSNEVKDILIQKNDTELLKMLSSNQTIERSSTKDISTTK